MSRQLFIFVITLVLLAGASLPPERPCATATSYARLR